MVAVAENITSLRAEIDRSIEAGSPQLASLRLNELWRLDNGPAAAAFVCSRFQKLRGNLPLLSSRVAILRSFTLEPAVPLLRAAAFCSGLDLTVHLGEFNAYSQELLDPGSSLYQFNADVVILAVRTCDLAPDLWNTYADLTPDAINNASSRVCASLQQWMDAFRRHSQAALIIHDLEQPLYPSFGILDAQLQAGQAAVIRNLNSELRALARTQRGVYVFDYDDLLARHGRCNWHDERKWLTARMPISASHLIHLANEWLRYLVPLRGKLAKALVVDLDNTLWGGIIGEDGMAGIKLGPEYPGAAFQSFQRALLDLTRRGILLAVCSKNNPADALEALREHPGMVLRPEHFASIRIGWTEKTEGLREIAAELNIGIDALAFVDDNPFEREQVRASLPEVTVIDLPDDPLHYVAALRACPALERLTLSEEDQQRTSMYAQQRERSQAEQSFRSKEDFYQFLQQEAEISPATPLTLARIAQLTQKTNQFNLTTRRYTEQQISDLAASAGWQVLSIRVRDRFGDHGLVGVAITHDHDDTCEIDTFLLSCRVIGRTVETALLSYVANGASARARRRLVGRFVPTKKNAPAREFYSQHGFQLESQNGDGAVWTLNLHEKQIDCPAWINLVSNNGGKS